MRKIKNTGMRDESVKKLLRDLNPSEDSNGSYRNFQAKRRKMMVTVMIIGVVSAIGIHLCSRMDMEFAEGAFLARKEWNAGDYQTTLQAITKEQVYELPINVKARKLTEQEYQQMLWDIRHLLPELMKKENLSLEQVTGDLYLPLSVQGYPFAIVWNSSNEERITRSGEINRRNIEGEKEKVLLTATVSDAAVKEVFTYEVYLLREELDEEELFLYQLQEKLDDADTESVFQKKLILPETVGGKEVLWKKVREDNSLWILLLTLIGSICISRGMEYDLKQRVKKRNQQMLLNYPDFVSRLRLYLSAGLTVKNAFYRITKELQGQRDKDKKRYLREEMQIACYQLENGVPEVEVYQTWGSRCGEMHYRRLSFLLSVHLKQGNAQLLAMLAQEADHAQEERRNHARKAGEEAGTRLLAPMMLMLLVVMFLILLPAYIDFGGI